MLGAIRAVYGCTSSMLRPAAVTASGVEAQGTANCLLFVIYLDQLVGTLDHDTGVDGFTGSLHAPLGVHGAVLGATSRKMCLRKLDAVVRCEESVVVLNEKKTFFSGGWGGSKFSSHVIPGCYCLLHKPVLVLRRLARW